MCEAHSAIGMADLNTGGFLGMTWGIWPSGASTLHGQAVVVASAMGEPPSNLLGSW
jgi:hypothetical protein